MSLCLSEAKFLFLFRIRKLLLLIVLLWGVYANAAAKAPENDLLLYNAVAGYQKNNFSLLFNIGQLLMKKADPNICLPGKSGSAFAKAAVEHKDAVLITLLVNGGGKITDQLLQTIQDNPTRNLLMSLKNQKKVPVFDYLLSVLHSHYVQKFKQHQRYLQEKTKKKKVSFKSQLGNFCMDLVPQKAESAKYSHMLPLRVEVLNAGRKVAELRFSSGRLNGWNFFYYPSGECSAAFLMKDQALQKVLFYNRSDAEKINDTPAILSKLTEITTDFWKSLDKCQCSFYVVAFTIRSAEKIPLKLASGPLNIITVLDENNKRGMSFMFNQKKANGLRCWYDDKGFCYAEESVYDGKGAKCDFYMPFSLPDVRSLMTEFRADKNPFQLPEYTKTLHSQKRGISDTAATVSPGSVSARSLKKFSKSQQLDLNVSKTIPFNVVTHYDSDADLFFGRYMAGFRARYLQTYGRRSAGYSIRYVQNDCHADIFIYDSRNMDVEHEMQAFVKNMKLTEKMGIYRNVSVDPEIKTGILKHSGVKYQANMCSYSRKQRGAWKRFSSLTLILKRNSHFIKLRISSSVWNPRQVNAFIEFLDKAIYRRDRNSKIRSGTKQQLVLRGKSSGAQPKRALKTPYYDPDLKVAFPLLLNGYTAFQLKHESKKDPGFEICYIKDDYHADVYVVPAGVQSFNAGFARGQQKYASQFRVLQLLKVIKKAPQIVLLPIRKFNFAPGISYQPYYYKYDCMTKDGLAKPQLLAGIFFQANGRNFQISLFNHNGNKNNRQELEGIVADFDRKVLSVLKQHPPRRSSVQNAGSKSEENFSKIVDKQSFL